MKSAIIILILFLFNVSAFAQEPISDRFGFGAEFGTISGTIDGGQFGMAFTADYRIEKNFTFGEIISFTPTGDLFQIHANTVAKFNIPVDPVAVIPYLGIGLAYGNVDIEGVSESAFGIGFPIGATVAYYLAENIQAAFRTQLMIYNLDYGPLGKDSSALELMLGFRYSP